jgi:hypothetical protein
MNAVKVSRVVMVNDSGNDEDRITLIPSGEEDFIPSDQGETCALFMTDNERNLLARLLTTCLVTAVGPTKAVARELLLKMPRRHS